jgi:hypothetical protein
VDQGINFAWTTSSMALGKPLKIFPKTKKIFWGIFANGRVAIAHHGPRDVAEWSIAGGRRLRPHPIDGLPNVAPRAVVERPVWDTLLPMLVAARQRSGPVAWDPV